MAMNKLCALCLTNSDLQESHIIPKFVIRWLKNGFPIRSNQNVNRRVQDGLKLPLLCRNCEQLFSGWEKRFSEQIFIPLHDSQPVTKRIEYRKWMLKFAVSISWRVIIHYKQISELDDYTDEQMNLVNEALEVWRKYLLDELPNPQKFEQHILPMDIISSHTVENFSPFMNRYLTRSFQFDILTSEDSIIVYTKLCRLLLFGFVKEKNSNIWQGTKIKVNKGDISPRNYKVPGGIFHYLNDEANKAHVMLESMSNKQKEIIDKFRDENIEKYVNSDVYRAMERDIYFSGSSAFSPKNVKESDDK
jgi:hypothetical protein